MGAVFGMVALIGALMAVVGAVYGVWAVLTFVKYVLYIALKVGSMPMADYFRYYYKRLGI